jgi:hypothetical protein
VTLTPTTDSAKVIFRGAAKGLQKKLSPLIHPFRFNKAFCFPIHFYCDR